MHPIGERCSRRAVQLQEETVTGEDCQMPSHMAFMMGGPKDGEHMAIDQFLNTIRIPTSIPPPVELDPVMRELETQFPTTLTWGNYRAQGWAIMTHNLPWCDRDHYVIEYLWRP